MYTDSEYVMVHVAVLVGTFVAATIIAGFPRVWLILPLFAFVIAPALLFNSMFHVGASVLTQSYCPGTITALLYLPLVLRMIRWAIHDGLLPRRSVAIVLLVARVFHTWEVGRKVFHRW